MLSVVIPCYNEERYLERCAASLLSQSHKDFEAIFVDDGSTDGTLAMLRALARKDKRVRVLAQKNAGPGAARNNGARSAKGDILVFVDADMMFDKDYLRDLTMPIRKGKEIGTTHSKELVANIENIWARSFSINRVPEETAVRGCGVFRAVRKDKFLEVGGFDPGKGYFDDDLSAIGLSTPTPAICYHNNPESLHEVFRHSLWMGRSLVTYQNTRKRFLPLVLLSFVYLAALMLSFALRQRIAVVALCALALCALVLLLAALTLPRLLKERRPEYLVSIPILWLIRLTGFYVGALQRLSGRRA